MFGADDASLKRYGRIPRPNSVSDFGIRQSTTTGHAPSGAASAAGSGAWCSRPGPGPRTSARARARATPAAASASCRRAGALPTANRTRNDVRQRTLGR